MADIPDFKSYADVTDRIREIRETIRFILSLPERATDESGIIIQNGIDPQTKYGIITSLAQGLNGVSELPSRMSMSKELERMEKLANQVEAINNMIKSLITAVNIKNDIRHTDNTTGSQNTAP